MLKRLTLPLVCTMLLCVWVFFSTAIQLVADMTVLMTMRNLDPGSAAGQALWFLPLLGQSLLLLFTAFTFARILVRGSRFAAKLFLAIVFALAGVAFHLSWEEFGVADMAWLLGYMLLLAALFFSLQRGGPEAPAP